MALSFYFMLVLIILLEWILRRNNGKKYHTNSRYTLDDLSFFFFPHATTSLYEQIPCDYFRSKIILHSLTWRIKVLQVVIQRGMQNQSEFFSMTVILLDVPNHMQRIWDFMARELDV